MPYSYSCSNNRLNKHGQLETKTMPNYLPNNGHKATRFHCRSLTSRPLGNCDFFCSINYEANLNEAYKQSSMCAFYWLYSSHVWLGKLIHRNLYSFYVTFHIPTSNGSAKKIQNILFALQVIWKFKYASPANWNTQGTHVTISRKSRCEPAQV